MATAATAGSVTASLRLPRDGSAGLGVPSWSRLRNSMTLPRPHRGSFPVPVPQQQQQLSVSPHNGGRYLVPRHPPPSWHPDPLSPGEIVCPSRAP